MMLHTKIGETIPVDVLLNVNRFTMKKVVSSYQRDWKII